jgi:hypothetical protein
VHLLSDEEYRSLQLALVFRPQQGKVIQGSGGIRKLRWFARGSGKRGGLRIIYHWDRRAERLYLLRAYRKSRQDDLTPEQLKVLRRLVQEELS